MYTSVKTAMQQKNIARTLGYALLGLLTLSGSKAAGQQSQPSRPPLTLRGAVDSALRLNPALAASELGVKGAEFDQRKNRGKLLPEINLSGSYSLMLKKQKVYFGGGDSGGAMPGGAPSPFGNLFGGDGIEMGERHSLQGGINAGMPLIAPQLWASLQLDQRAVELAEEKARGSRVALISEVRKAYLGVLLARESARTLQSSYDNTQQNYQQITQKYEHGLVAEYDKIRMETQLKNLLPQLLSARNTERLAEAKLKVIMGLPLSDSISLGEALPAYEEQIFGLLPESGEHAATALSLERNSDLRSLGLQQRQLEAALKVKKAAFLPTLSLSFTYQYNYAADQLRLDNSKRWSPFSTLGLSLNVPLYNGGARYNDLRASRVQIQQLQLQRLATQRQLELGLENARTEQRNALATFVAARDAVASASRGHEIARVRYSSGASTLLELNDAELALLQARLALSQAIHQYMISVFSLDELQGLDQLP